MPAEKMRVLDLCELRKEKIAAIIKAQKDKQDSKV